ncbi:MAG: hypothetical protein FGM32_10960 [Candidatus Kapabacteria bacterium]|nr:hypothetical protein [Candidatus Kapabacteria bacterium]
MYADNEPITKKDPSGAIWETIWDVANVVVDAARVVYHSAKGNKEAAKEAAVDLAFDAAATIVPGLPAGINKLRHADEVAGLARAGNKVVDAGRVAEKAVDPGKGRDVSGGQVTGPSAEAEKRGLPKTSPKFQTPTNGPQLPPTNIPDGWRVRQMPPTSQYPHGYWRLEKPMVNGGWQAINPSTMKPGTRSETHVPLPAKEK